MSLKLLTIIFSLMVLNNHMKLKAQTFIAYSLENFEGKYAPELYDCGGFSSLDRNISSADPGFNCFRLYDQERCAGNFIEISPRTPSARKLADWKFDNLGRSAGPCIKSCPSQISEGSAQVKIFRQKGFKGSYHDIEVKGCTQIPAEYHNHTKSIQTNDFCIQLYKTEQCVSEPDVNTIELRPGTPYHDDLSTSWRFPVVKAINLCDYKCLNVSFMNAKEGDVFLFEKQNLTGKYYNFSVLNAQCIHLPLFSVILAESIGLGNNTCVILYEWSECSNGPLKITETKLSLITENFSGRIRSLSSCNENVLSATFITTKSSEIQTPSFLTSTVQTLATEITTEVVNVTEYLKFNNKQPESSNFSPLQIVLIVVVPLAAVILTAVVVVSVCYYCSRHKKDDSNISEEKIREFLTDKGIDLLAIDEGSTNNKNDYPVEFKGHVNEYNIEYELLRSNIEIDSSEILGSGEFGLVYKGKLAIKKELKNSFLTNATEKTTVAIKTVNQTSGLSRIRSLWKEVKVMMYIGHHKNIVKLIGCCTENIKEGDIMAVMEYCSEGSLESYLKKNRVSFRNLVNNGKPELESKTSFDINETDKPEFDTLLIIKWGLEIAHGMEFLSNAKVVHSDLAARNILLNENLVAKISDFGLSRQLYAYSQYMKKHQEPLPFRWMAIESLKNLEFSTMSDIWSYGVLLWEIFSLGGKPYPGLRWNDAFILNLERGLRLAKPKNSTNELYNLMLRCWNENPTGRPLFKEIVEEIQEMKASLTSPSDAYITLY